MSKRLVEILFGLLRMGFYTATMNVNTHGAYQMDHDQLDHCGCARNSNKSG